MLMGVVGAPVVSEETGSAAVAVSPAGSAEVELGGSSMAIEVGSVIAAELKQGKSRGSNNLPNPYAGTYHIHMYVYCAVPCNAV